nr:MAG TPA: hypothetical protein [Caudoviricetes sp.]
METPYILMMKIWSSSIRNYGRYLLLEMEDRCHQN